MQTLEVNQSTDIRRSRSRSTLPSLDYKLIAELFSGSDTGDEKPQRTKSVHSTLASDPPVAERCMFFSTNIGPLWRESLKAFRLHYYGKNTESVLEQSPFWLNIVDPTEVELAELQKAFVIHPLTIEDVKKHHGTRQKCDIFPLYTFIQVKSANDEWFAERVRSCPISILIFRGCIITIQYNQNRHAEDVLLRISSTEQQISCEFICYALFDSITDKFMLVSRIIQKEIDAIDELVTILKSTDQGDMLKRISGCRRKVLKLSRIVNTKPELIRSVLTRFMSTSEMVLYMEDIFGILLLILDQSLTLKRDFEQFENMLSHSHSHYLAGINIEITQSSLRGSEIANRITGNLSNLNPSAGIYFGTFKYHYWIVWGTIRVNIR
jgi:Mg2+ and Co2+ transporter CorA